MWQLLAHFCPEMQYRGVIYLTFTSFFQIFTLQLLLSFAQEILGWQNTIFSFYQSDKLVSPKQNEYFKDLTIILMK